MGLALPGLTAEHKKADKPYPARAALPPTSRAAAAVGSGRGAYPNVCRRFLRLPCRWSAATSARVHKGSSMTSRQMSMWSAMAIS